MELRKLRFWLVGILLLFVLVGSAYCAWMSSRPRMKQFVWNRDGYIRPPEHPGIRFSYPADFRLDGYVGNEICLSRNPPTGITAWLDEHLHKGLKSGWDEARISIYYKSHPARSLYDAVNSLLPWMSSASDIQQASYRVGPAAVIDGRVGNEAAHLIVILPNPSRAGDVVWSSGSEVTVIYQYPKRIELQMRRVVDDLVRSMEVVPL
jgi:hypothetical protein